MKAFTESENRANSITDVKAFTVVKDDAKLPVRKADAHKGDFGRVLIIAGSVGYTGAPALAARAAVRMGSGLVFLGVPQDIYAVEAVKCDEAMPFPLPCETGRIAASAADVLI